MQDDIKMNRCVSRQTHGQKKSLKPVTQNKHHCPKEWAMVTEFIKYVAEVQARGSIKIETYTLSVSKNTFELKCKYKNSI